MEDSDRIRSDEVSANQGQYEVSEQEVGSLPTRKHTFHIEGTKEKEEREKQTAQERMDAIWGAVKGFRIITSGDGLLRGGFGKLPLTPAQELLDQMKDLSKAMDQFNLTGDNLNVSGSFDKGYTVTRENPCDQQQVNQT